MSASAIRMTGDGRRDGWAHRSFALDAPTTGLLLAPAAALIADGRRRFSTAAGKVEAVPMRRLPEAKSSGSASAPNTTSRSDAIDRALMERVVARDPRAFAELAERHTAMAIGLAQRIVRNTADAEDVVQESLARLWMFSDRWNAETARFSSWFYRIVTNQAISRIRKKTTESIESVEEPSDTAPSPHDQLAGREIGTAIVEAVSRLPDRQRAAIALCYDQGLSCAEAAESMGVSIGTMESLLFRARRSLREWLGPLSSDLVEG
jgi:RNA polymerase sigma-70 factor (ECF subfamily)